MYQHNNEDNEMEEKIEKFLTEDGRNAEDRIHVVQGENGEEQIIHEVYEEQKVLTKRIVEIKKPVIVETITETIKHDEVIDTKDEVLISQTEDVQDDEVVRRIVKTETKTIVEDVEEDVKEEEVVEDPEKNVSHAQSLLENKFSSQKVTIWSFIGLVVIVSQLGVIAWLLL